MLSRFFLLRQRFSFKAIAVYQKGISKKAHRLIFFQENGRELFSLCKFEKFFLAAFHVNLP